MGKNKHCVKYIFAWHTAPVAAHGGGGGEKEKCGDRVESNSQSSQRAPYLKAPPASFNGDPLLPHRYEKARLLSIR